jgi:threonylcarbamoyladenosine tRNA methylthiotransferase MtaB
VQVSKEEVCKIPEIDICLGTNEKANIVKFVEEFKESKKKEIEAEDVFLNPEYTDFGTVTYTENTRAVIKIQDGCDRFCSYCLIPYARGRVRSRSKDSIIKEIEDIVKTGIKEVVITGIHIASYGKDFKEKFELIDLLEEINKIDNLKRVRLGSIEPLLITDEFMKRFSKLEKMCHHFHLSLQSGCTKTLQRMNRRYSAEEFEEITKKIRNTYLDSILTTDVIVRFSR